MSEERTRTRTLPIAGAAILVAACLGYAVLSSLNREPNADLRATPPATLPAPMPEAPAPPVPLAQDESEEDPPLGEEPSPHPAEPEETGAITPRLDPEIEREIFKRTARESITRSMASDHLRGGGIETAIQTLSLLQDGGQAARREFARHAAALRTFDPGRLATGYARVRKALLWLAAHQDPKTGAFLNATHGEVCGEKSCRSGTSAAFDPGVTGLALLAFHSFRDLDVRRELEVPARRCADHLVSLVHADGTVGRRHTHYTEAIVALALTEWAGELRDRAPARRAAENILDYLGKRGILRDGGWRYNSASAFSDTSVTCWVLQALLTAKRSGMEKLDPTIASGLAFLDRCTDADGWTGYSAPNRRSPNLTAAATFVRLLSGVPREDPGIEAATKNLVSQFGPAWKQARHPRAAAKLVRWVRTRNWESYWWYYASHAFQALRGEEWPTLCALAQAALPDGQVENGHLAGSWDPEAARDKKVGRLYVTAMKALALTATLHR